MHVQVTYEAAVQYLVKAHQLATGVPFQWGYIDRPQEGSLFIVFLLPQQRVFPNDGVRYQEQETRYTIPAGGGRVSNTVAHELVVYAEMRVVSTGTRSM